MAKKEKIRLEVEKALFDDVLFAITTDLPNYKLVYEINRVLGTSLEKTNSEKFEVFHWKESGGNWLLIANKIIEEGTIEGFFTEECIQNEILLEERFPSVNFWFQIPSLYNTDIQIITEKLKQIQSIRLTDFNADLLHNFLTLSTNYAYK